MRITHLKFLITPLLAVSMGAALAQSDWPAKPIRIVVPFAAGGTTDITARVIADELTRAIGQSVIVDNKAGAGGNVGASEVARAAPDGYTFLMGTPGTQAINQFLYPKMPYDTAKDFAPVSFVVRVPNVLVVNPALGAKSLKDLIEIAKKKPGSLSYGSPGNGTTGHLSTELFKNRAGVFVTHIPYQTRTIHQLRNRQMVASGKGLGRQDRLSNPMSTRRPQWWWPCSPCTCRCSISTAVAARTSITLAMKRSALPASGWFPSSSTLSPLTLTT